MYIFIDESGDLGFKFEHGSSHFFTVSLIVFNDKIEAIKCDKNISGLKERLGWADSDEFHFKRNSENIRMKFLKTVSRFDFKYYAIVIDKTSFKYKSKNFHDKKDLYNYILGLVFEVTQKQLKQADVVIDKSGNPEFRNRLCKYLRNKINTHNKIIKKIRMQRSESNNLLQLADYVAGIINRSIVKNKTKSDEYRRILKAREGSVEII